MLYVWKAHPNPVGRDHPRNQPPTNEKLNEEWIEFLNNQTYAVPLQEFTLHDYTFDGRCVKTGERQLQTYTGTLQPGHSVRVHTGTGQTYNTGTVWHLFLNWENFVWNNACGDYVVLRRNTNLDDWASYEPNPPDGVVLERVPGTNLLR